MKSVIKHSILMLIGALIYMLVEILYRGYTHWTMGLVGGVCFVLIGLINEFLSWNTPLFLQGVIGSVIVTLLEFISGVILNIHFKLGIWDYSQMPFNVLGQICLYFSIAWFFLSIVAIILDDFIRYKLFNEEKPNYRLILKEGVSNKFLNYRRDKL